MTSEDKAFVNQMFHFRAWFTHGIMDLLALQHSLFSIVFLVSWVIIVFTSRTREPVGVCLFSFHYVIHCLECFTDDMGVFIRFL